MKHNKELESLSLSTAIQHTGKAHRLGRGLIGAIESSVTFATPAIEDSPVYSRLGNTTNHFEAEAVLAKLHHGEEAIATGSGMACLNLIITSLLQPGDHILVLDSCYGGTFNLLTKVFARWGIESSFKPLKDWEQHRRKNTRMVIFESITNPFCQPQNIGAAIDFAKRHQLISVCDNTFASPLLCQPLLHGADLVFESATKYLNGHSDVIAGMVSGKSSLLATLRSCHAYLGTFLPPQQCMQLLRGIRTLDVRMKQHSLAGAKFAAAMRKSSLVETVNYGLPTEDPAMKYFPDGFGGMVSVRFAKNVDVKKLLGETSLVTNVPSLGGTESTATMPTFTTNWFMSAEQKKEAGIDEQLVRFSIGLENPDDVIQDVFHAASQAHYQA